MTWIARRRAARHPLDRVADGGGFHRYGHHRRLEGGPCAGTPRTRGPLRLGRSIRVVRLGHHIDCHVTLVHRSPSAMGRVHRRREPAWEALHHRGLGGTERLASARYDDDKVCTERHRRGKIASPRSAKKGRRRPALGADLSSRAIAGVSRGGATGDGTVRPVPLPWLPGSGGAGTVARTHTRLQGCDLTTLRIPQPLSLASACGHRGVCRHTQIPAEQARHRHEQPLRPVGRAYRGAARTSGNLQSRAGWRFAPDYRAPDHPVTPVQRGPTPATRGPSTIQHAWPCGLSAQSSPQQPPLHILNHTSSCGCGGVCTSQPSPAAVEHGGPGTRCRCRGSPWGPKCSVGGNELMRSLH